MKTFTFNAKEYEGQLKAIFKQLYYLENDNKLTDSTFRKALNKNPKDKGQLFSKDELILGEKHLREIGAISKSDKKLKILKMKPIRTSSGVAPITVLTKPYDCPGKCIFCPQQEGMPQSYLADEPGAQRAALLKFDPYNQITTRIKALEAIGHISEKVELIILGGTWSVYSKEYKNWFILNCLNAMNQDSKIEKSTDITLKDIQKAQHKNQSAKYRSVGISIETRPNLINEKELINLRELGVTKIQIGIQSLDDEILKLNKRGHTSKTSANAFKLLRSFGFKIQIHWMPNLYGSSVKKDINDYKKLWTKDFRPDEVKIYPTSILPGTELEELYNSGKYKPYTKEELLKVITSLKKLTPEYCRITRIIRDIPAQNIVAGNKLSNFREIAQKELKSQGIKCKCIRCREIRNQNPEKIALKIQNYTTSVGIEYFLSYCSSPENLIAGFLRLTIPDLDDTENHYLKELQNKAIIREVHVYGNIAAIGENSNQKVQHSGLGRNLIKKAKDIAKQHGFNEIAVIAAIGTQNYYKKHQFEDSGIYMTSKV